MADNDRWMGWAMTGGILMMVVGFFRVFSGVIGLFNDEWIIRGYEAYYFVDLSALAWWYIIVGVLLLAAGASVLNGQTWGRVIGIMAVGLAMFSELFWLPVYPIWSIILVTLYTFILIGLVMARTDN